VCFGEPTEAFARVAERTPPVDLEWKERLPALVLIVSLLVIGIWPKSIGRAIDAAVAPAPAGEVRNS